MRAIYCRFSGKRGNLKGHLSGELYCLYLFFNLLCLQSASWQRGRQPWLAEWGKFRPFLCPPFYVASSSDNITEVSPAKRQGGNVKFAGKGGESLSAEGAENNSQGACYLHLSSIYLLSIKFLSCPSSQRSPVLHTLEKWRWRRHLEHPCCTAQCTWAL